MIEATTQKDLLEGYQRAYRAAKQADEQNWHVAWRYYHEVATRRSDGQPLLPDRANELTSSPGAGSRHRLPEDRQLAPNQVLTILRTTVASTLNRNPEFSLDPEFEGFAAPAKAKLATCALNSVWRREHFNDPIRDAYFDCLMYGRGWVKVGWQASFTDKVSSFEAAGEVTRSVLKDAIDAVNSLSRRGARLGVVPPTPEQIEDHLKKFNGRVLVEDKPTLRKISPFDMFMDPMALALADARWVANRWTCPTAFVKTNTDWAEKPRRAAAQAKGDIGTTLNPDDEDAGGDTGEYGGADTVWIVDFYDLSEGTWCQFVEGGEGFLRKPEPIPFTFGHPFVCIENVDDTASSKPISEVEMIWAHQKALTDIVNDIGVDRLQSRPKIMVPKDQEEQLRPVLESKDQGMVIPVEFTPGVDLPMTSMIQTWQGQSNAEMLMAEANMTAQHMVQASGTSDYLTGGGGGETATEVNAKQMASANFMGEKASRVRDFIEGTAQRILMMMQTYSRLDYFVTSKAYREDPETGEGRVTDVTMRFGRKEMAGSYRVIVSADSTEQRTPQAKAARAQAIASVSVPFIQLGVVDPALLYRYLMTEGFDIDDPSMLLTQNAYMAQPVDPTAPQTPPAGAGGPAGIGGISMTPGSMAGQMGATVAAERFDNGDMVPSMQ